MVVVALQGAYGKPRPALVIQSDLFSALPSVTILPITSDLREAPLYRIDIEAAPRTGLHKPSQIMVDKPQTIPREKVGEVIGSVNAETMLAVSRSLTVFLGIA
ncbi:type II toxin-antitoxin system PemK/MazF family toxin [Azotobacter vinelandii]